MILSFSSVTFTALIRCGGYELIETPIYSVELVIDIIPLNTFCMPLLSLLPDEPRAMLDCLIDGAVRSSERDAI